MASFPIFIPICVHKFSVAAYFNAYAKYVHKRKALRIAADDVPVNCVKKNLRQTLYDYMVTRT